MNTVYISAILIASLWSAQAAKECDPNDILPHETHCNMYYVCREGKKMVKQCPIGLHFSGKTGQCEEVHKACCGGCHPPCQSCKPKCGPGVKVGDMISHDHECCKFKVCTNYGWVDQRCAPGTHFNNRTKVCDWPENACCDPDCPCAEVPVETPCPGGLHIGDRMADPYDCSSYLLCTDVGLVSVQCPDCTHFNPKTLRCESPEHACCTHNISTTQAIKFKQLLDKPIDCSKIYAAFGKAATTV